MSVELKQLQSKGYEVLTNGISIGTITLSRNSFHAGNLYLKLELSSYDTKLSADLFRQLWKEQQSEKRFQMMCDSSEAELIKFMESAGFTCRRRCFECEVTEKDWKHKTDYLIEIRQYGNDTEEYQKACELLYHQYAWKHEKVNPLTANYEEFIEKLPRQIYVEKLEDIIQNFAFVEENEIAYVGSVKKETYPAFLASVVKQLFSKYDTICFEADDTDPEAMLLMGMFETDPEESYNTYILERMEE